MKRFRDYPVGSPEYVILHALWRKKRGRQHLSVPFLTIRNPEKALGYALMLLQWEIFTDETIKSYCFGVNIINEKS